MKNKFSVLIFSMILLVLVSCKKEENKVYLESGTAPVLTASAAGPLVLTDANKNNQAIKFSWTNPEYRFTTGVSSQNVSYILEVDTTGANFTNPNKQQLSFSSSTDVTYSVKELNSILTRLNLTENMPHNIEFRLRAALDNNSVPLYSNIIKMVITPYLDVAVPVPPSGDLFITGDATASGWTNTPPVSQKFTKISNVEYTITMNFTSGFYYKFLSNQNQWQPQYGGNNATGGDLGFNMGNSSDPSAIPTPSVAGTYKISVNFKTGKYTVVKI